METRKIFRRYVVTSVEEMMEAVENEETVICVKGTAYEEIKESIIKQKTSAKRNKILTGVLWGASVLSGGTLTWLLFGAGCLSFHKGKDKLKKYELIDNENNTFFDLVRVKGEDAFNPTEDLIGNADESVDVPNVTLQTSQENPIITNWTNILEKLQQDNQIEKVSYETWIKPLELIKVDENVVYLNIPLEAQKEFVTKKYLQPLKICIAEVTGQEYDVKWIDNENDTKEHTIHQGNDTIEVNEEEVLNHWNKFGTFFVSKNNKFAYSVSFAVATNPCELYNPLVLYGESGTGKTHLMQAIAHSIMKHHPDKKVLYTTGNTFSKEFAETFKCDVDNPNKFTMTNFREKYQNVDVLLMDDIEPIISNETLQEEFYQLFNHLHSKGKHIIVSSNKAPKDLEMMEERLKKCLEKGLIADISLPDEETKKEILKRQEKFAMFS